MTRRTAFNGSSSARRRSRLKAQAVERDLIESQVYRALGMKPEQKEQSVRKAEIICKRQVSGEIQYPAPPTDYQVQIYNAAEHHMAIEIKRCRKFHSEPKSERGVNAIARQKMRGHSIPLI